MSIDISQIVRSKRKTLAIIVKHDGTVVVRVPMRATNKSIREFIEQHTDWIERKQAELRNIVAAPSKQFIAGETFMFLGKLYPLEIVRHQNKPLLLDGSFKLAESVRTRAEIVMESWFRKQAKKLIQERVNFYANQYGFQYQGFKITSARTRWGSCSAKGSLNFSWRLIMAPMEQVDYVVAHELVHTIHHNHSERFWKKLKEIMPDFKERKKWLKQHGPLLMV